ncbi:hypothetical protein [Mycolicibacterium llatzerense]|jgi:hypothetical protein|uniref:hypothetical protein n=1 Tax=Mycolicibacterium llatzerense TaxID=280871 RepID=UPI0021B5DA8C|nr:hypothetical protein [Mycolicibacterium llatzerense]MCT7361560.1 hypothetical protein [Mycolicibacterium llatzerense]
MMCRKPYCVLRVREATDAEIAATARIDVLISQQLPSVRTTAENWRNGVGFGAVASFSLALQASFGWPAFKAISTENDLRQWESSEVAATIRYLRTSMILVIPAFLGFCAASAVLIFHVPLPWQFPPWRQ